METYKPTVGELLELIDDDVIVSVYHINVAYIYYGPAKDAPFNVRNYYRAHLIDPEGKLLNGTMRCAIVCEKMDPDDLKKHMKGDENEDEEIIIQTTELIFT